MMARSTALQAEAGYIDARPHLLIVEIFLRRTAGPYIRVICVDLACPQPRPVFPETADAKVRVSTQRATFGHGHKKTNFLPGRREICRQSSGHVPPVSIVHDFTASHSMNTCTRVGTLSGRSIVISDQREEISGGRNDTEIRAAIGQNIELFSEIARRFHLRAGSERHFARLRHRRRPFSKAMGPRRQSNLRTRPLRRSSDSGGTRSDPWSCRSAAIRR